MKIEWKEGKFGKRSKMLVLDSHTKRELRHFIADLPNDLSVSGNEGKAIGMIFNLL